MSPRRRSNCPISYSLDLFGDRWSLLVLRDLAFGGARRYQQFLESPEGIATNVLADRLKRLERAGLIRKRRSKEDQRRFVYSMTERGLDTLPILLEMIRWGAAHDSRTAAPAGYITRLRRDREGLIAELRALADKED